MDVELPMITIEDIAREAGVSATTVSNVIHGRTNKVSSYTVELINEIIRERGYVPNLSARAMKTRSSKVVALINHLESRDQPKFMSDPFSWISPARWSGRCGSGGIF